MRGLSDAMAPIYATPEIAEYSHLLTASFRRLTGRDLLAPGPDLPRRLFDAPFALVSHGTQPDPIFRYANRAALDLWQMDWAGFATLPSRLSAEPMLREERDRLLEQARRKGFIDDYEGVRIGSTGRRFMIRDTVLWNVVDERGVLLGQACVIGRWEFLG